MFICNFSKTGDTYVLVSSSDDRKDTFIESVLNSVVEGIRVTTTCHYPSAAVTFSPVERARGVYLTKAHVDRSLLSTTLAHNVIDSPVEAVKDDGGARRLALEDLDGQKVGLLGHSVGLAANGTSNVRSVADAVNMAATSGVVCQRCAALELDVVDIDATVDNVGIGACASAGVVDVVGACLSLVGNAAQAPWGALLSGQGVKVPDLVLLNMGNLCTCKPLVLLCAGVLKSTDVCALADFLDGGVIEGASVGGEILDLVALLDTDGRFAASGITTLQIASVKISGPKSVRLNGSCIGARLEGHDVLARNLLSSTTSFLDRRAKDGWQDSSKEQQSALDRKHGADSDKTLDAGSGWEMLD